MYFDIYTYTAPARNLKNIDEEKRLEDATASLGERSITGYAETTCRRARMYAVPIGLSGGQYLADRGGMARRRLLSPMSIPPFFL